MTARRLLLICALFAPLYAGAQSSPSAGSELGLLKLDFEYGKYKEVLQRGRTLLDRGGLNDEQLADLHRLCGVAAFNLQQMSEAERHLTTLLRIDPDAALDPFLFPPPAVQYLEKLKKQLASDLELIRQERRLQADRRRREEEDKERAARETEDLRVKLDEFTNRVTVRTVEKRVFLVNFMPFGAGQFQQGRNTQATVLATTEGALAATSLIAFLAYRSLFKEYHVTIPNALNPDGSGSFNVTYTAIPRERTNEAIVWWNAQYVAAIGFYLVWGYGVVDAILNHRDQNITTQMEELGPKGPGPITPTPPQRSLKPPGAKADAALTLVPGGLGAQLRVQF